jgi:hypothetical protein
MSVRSISLRKLIIILFSPASCRVSGIRKDIREEISRSRDAVAGSGDFVRVLLFRNVSAPHLTELDVWRLPKAVCAGDFGLARGYGSATLERVEAIFVSVRTEFKSVSSRCRHC